MVGDIDRGKERAFSRGSWDMGSGASYGAMHRAWEVGLRTGHRAGGPIWGYDGIGRAGLGPQDGARGRI